MSRLRINGTELRVLEAGVGDPVVLVHGSASDYRTWEAQVDSLTPRYRVLRYSRRYHWPNPPIPEGADYSMTEHVDDLEALLAWTGAAPAHLVGHSYGGFISLLLAMRRPDLVRTLTLAEPPLLSLFVSDPPRPTELLTLFLTRPRTALAIARFGIRGVAPAGAAAERGDMEEAMEAFGRAVLGDDAFEGLSDERVEQVMDNGIAAELLGSGFPPLVPEEVRGVHTPTLLISAAESPPLFHRLVDGVASLLPNRERAEIPGASHVMHEDDPSRFNTHVLDFLDRHSGFEGRESQ
ncbi:MAG: alpha/beta hydrolase [Longimicrobiales bacterium]|nr:alpha/beta hydrolase [Longimicrobiales bacterium]